MISIDLRNAVETHPADLVPPWVISIDVRTAAETYPAARDPQIDRMEDDLLRVVSVRDKHLDDHGGLPMVEKSAALLAFDFCYHYLFSVREAWYRFSAGATYSDY